MSHWLYTAPIAATQPFKDPGNGDSMIVELRSTGGQTVFPPSTHPSDEQIDWYAHGEPAPVDGAALPSAVGQLAACILLIRGAPAEGRHDYLLAISGVVIRTLGQTDGGAFLEIVAKDILGDLYGAADHKRIVDGTAERLGKGRRYRASRSSRASSVRSVHVLLESGLARTCVRKGRTPLSPNGANRST